jgi:hypothetical protein
MNALLHDIDSYDDEYHQFQWDVHVLIRGTLHASVRYLDAQIGTYLADIEAAIDKSQDTEHQQYLVDEHVDVLETNSRQERFLRNMALVALASRLTHALRTMSRSAESFSPRQKRYGKSSMSEFGRLWLEYTERFGIDFRANVDRIQFVETMREVRNQIVHDGGEANTFKPNDEIDWHADVVAYLDCSFSEKYPDYVSGDEVSVSREQLEMAVEASVNLVGWLAKELRTRELASIRKAK